MLEFHLVYDFKDGVLRLLSIIDKQNIDILPAKVAMNHLTMKYSW